MAYCLNINDLKSNEGQVMKNNELPATETEEDIISGNAKLLIDILETFHRDKSLQYV